MKYMLSAIALNRLFFRVVEYKHDYFPDVYHLPLCSLPVQPELEQGSDKPSLNVVLRVDAFPVCFCTSHRKFPLSPIWGNDVDK